VSCACHPVSFNGMWKANVSITLSDISTPSNSNTNCFDLQCSDVSSGVLAAESMVCNGTDIRLNTYQANFTFHLEEGCRTVNMSIVPGRVFSRAAQSPLALSFLETNFDLVGNDTFAVVSNSHGVIVGQIQSDFIQVKVRQNANEKVNITILPCILLDTSIDVNGQYDVFDIGILLDDGVTIRPVGLTNTFNLSEINVKICFSKMSLTKHMTSVILIKRYGNYESVAPYTSGEQSIVYTSGALFCTGAIFVFVCNFFVPFNLAVFSAGMECMVLLLFRGIYFFVLASGNLTVGGLLDFALIEIPTFIYIGIFLQIILVAYWLFFKSDDVSPTILLIGVMCCMLVNWLVFAAIMIAISFSNNSSSAPKWCDCQISYPAQQSDTAQIIRIVYKSVVLVVSLFVVFITVGYGVKHVRKRNRLVFSLVLILSLGLFFDCIAFLIYYSLSSPTAYFLIVLWFTELTAICVANGLLAKNDMNYYISSKWREVTDSSKASHSIRSLKDQNTINRMQSMKERF